MKKYFFFDIDGTLTTPLTADYPDSTREAIRRLQKAGHFVSLATGRIQADAVTIDGKILYDEGLALADCFAMLSAIDGEKHPWALAIRNEKYRITTTNSYLAKVKDRYYKTEVDPAFDFHTASVIHKIFIACSRQEEAEIPLGPLPHVWFRADTMLIEPIHKEHGIEELQRRFAIPDEDIVVFGDGMNDRTMFRPEWFSIAMGNAKPQLKEKAKYITSRADEDGIYEASRCARNGVSLNFSVATLLRKR